MNPDEAHASPALTRAITWAVVFALSAGSGAGAQSAARLSPQTDAQALVEFEKRVADYRALREKVEERLPARPTESTAQQIDKARRDLCRGIVAARNPTPRLETCSRPRYGGTCGGSSHEP